VSGCARSLSSRRLRLGPANKLREHLPNDPRNLATMPTHYLAIDLGAESGRVMLGTLAEGRLALEELHRFANTPVNVDGALTWNIPGLFQEIQSGLRRASARGLTFTGLSVDSWGVDYMLFDDAGAIIPPTFHYRDSRAARGVENARARVDWKTLYAETGIQFMALNTIFQLAAESPERLERAAQMLTIADGFHRMLCGADEACLMLKPGMAQNSS